MRIVTFDFSGRAPAVQLSRALAARGHNVLHLYSADVQTPKWDLTKHPDDPTGFSVRAVSLGSPPAEHRLWARFLYWRRYGRHFARIAREFQPQVVLATSSTLFLHRAFHAAFVGQGVQFVYWLQRFYFRRYDRTLRGRGGLVEAPLTYWVRRVESALLRSSDVIILPAEYLWSMLEEGDGISPRQCMVVRNWAPLDRVGPREKHNAWAQEHDIAAPCVVLHAGSLDEGRRAVILRLADLLRARPDVLLVTVSDTESTAILTREAGARGLKNLKALPFQDYAVFDLVLASADILLCLVKGEDGVLALPGKLPFYLCAGRAIVLAAPSENLAADIVREGQAGRVVAPDDAQAIYGAVMELADDEATRTTAARHARAYAEERFDIAKITDRFERLFRRIITGPPRSKQE